jgi:hydrogenase maturation protein HypF
MTRQVADAAAVRLRAHVSGLVQGVGFRPFVWRHATDLGLSGWVGNDSAGVVLEVEGATAAVDAFIAALSTPPPLSRVDDVSCLRIPSSGEPGFEIRTSDVGGARRALVSPDTGTCPDCIRELHDPDDRRYGHPFVNCTSCGPRYTIVASVPYDRSRTTMASFPMCASCRSEYEDPANRRFHAEPVCCPSCGPQLRLVPEGGAPLQGAVDALRRGLVLAVKGLGGYHLAVDASSEQAVARLRSRKHREDRPFALMVSDLEQARQLCTVDADEADLLMSPARPIVLLRRRLSAAVAPSVAPGSPTLGVMLAYTPLHILLLESFGRPLVMTSGNLSSEPIATDDGDAALRLAGLADVFLVHDRGIRTRVDDSVMSIVAGRVQPVRRSRGYAPTPVLLPQPAPEPVLACGSALKNTFCIARDRHAFVSGHIGDLDDHATYQSYFDGIDLLLGLLDVRPRVVAHDLHPEYPSTRYASDLFAADQAVELIGVQHHHAHIASCLADNGVTRPVIGVAFDGLGLGTDGTAWGGEFLIADLAGFERAAHLSTVVMPGGDMATRQPWRMALSHLDAAFGGDFPAGLAVVQRQGQRWGQVLSVARSGINATVTSSAGRLFDAVSALLGVRDVVTYEGQAAIELEHVADPTESGSYRVGVSDEPVMQVEIDSLVRDLTADLLAGTTVAVLSGRFHNALADTVLDVCVRLRDRHGLNTVALSGGVFQNALLVMRCVERLEASGFSVLTHRQVPPNDGGISLGQAAVAAAQLGLR